jgi:membrane-associated HD superfamily phosphohydrolase
MSRDMFDTGQKVTFLEWIFAYLILCIPVVNVIIIGIWSFSPKTKESKQTWAQLMLIFLIIAIVSLGVMLTNKGGVAYLQSLIPWATFPHLI